MSQPEAASIPTNSTILIQDSISICGSPEPYAMLGMKDPYIATRMCFMFAILIHLVWLPGPPSESASMTSQVHRWGFGSLHSPNLMAHCPEEAIAQCRTVA